jgi:hypothetical protein
MKKYRTLFILYLLVLNFSAALAQKPETTTLENKSALLFLEQTSLPIKLSFSIKGLKKQTNDSTYILSKINFKLLNGTWQPMEIKLRVRGNYRLKNCYFPPLKVKIKKGVSKNTLFQGNKTLKLVVPCLIQKDNDDNIIKEFLAYKLYEVISDYHFKTRLFDLSFEEIKKNKPKTHLLKGFFIEDNSTVAKRHGGEVFKRTIHPLNQDKLSSIRNTFFQFMIGNTDFSQAYRHNVKLFYINKEMIPIPYDFDMSGLVNTSYAVVSQINNKKLQNTYVTQRIYRGFERDYKDFQLVRQEFLANKTTLLSIMDAHSKYFDNPKEFSKARDYINSFYDILHDDKSFKKHIIDQAREK